MSSSKKPPGKLSKELHDIRKAIEDLEIAKNIYAGVCAEKSCVRVAEVGAEKRVAHQHPEIKNGKDFNLTKWFMSHAEKNNFKYAGAALNGDADLEKIASELWLDGDVVPFIGRSQVGAKKLARFAADQFIDGVSKVNIGKSNRVEVGFLASLDAYKKVSDKKRFDQLMAMASKFKGKRMMFFSATPRGGGVALMRHALMRLFNLLKVEASWHVLEERKEVFEITKTKFHNVLHGVAGPGIELTKEDKKIYTNWIKENVDKLKEEFKRTDVVIIDDPQPSGLVPHIRKINPKAKIIYRSHIQLETHLIRTPGTSQSKTWKFIWENIKSSDIFVSHPMEKFIPDEVPKEKVVFMPATTDRLDGLNKPLRKSQKKYYLKLFDKILLESGMTRLDSKRPFIIQIARFDPSKGINDVLASYKILREKCKGLDKKHIPQLVIVGNSSIDDPDGIPIYNLTMEIIEKEHAEYAEDIKVARLPHVDQLLNVLLSESMVALQLSHREGFEVKVTESLMKGVPVVAYDAGGIPLQLKDKVSGYLIELGNIRKVANSLCRLVNDNEHYKKISKSARKNLHPDVNTVSNAISWLFLANELADNGQFLGGAMYIRELINSN